jgi:hypothetical protein
MAHASADLAPALIDWGNRDGRYGRKLPPQLKGAL